MNRILRRLGATVGVGAMAVVVPLGSADAADAQAPLPAFPTLPAVPMASLTFMGPQVAIGPTVIGSVFNGGTAVVVANNPPINSGNIIASP